VKLLDRLLAFALGAAVAAVVILAIAVWQANYPFGFATLKETEELRARIAVLDRALRESESKAKSDAERWERTAEARAAAARAAEEAARRAREFARQREEQARVKRAEEEAARQAELVRARETAARRAREDAQKAAARQAAADKSPEPPRTATVTRDDVYQQAVAMESGGKIREAIRVYRRAARAGSGKAAKRLGDIFACGGAGIPRDYPESLQWYDTAFRLGESVPTTVKRDGSSCLTPVTAPGKPLSDS
jgi:eukaryotic-like serine/threonine-protein kinase